jgi:hypothetical protein
MKDNAELIWRLGVVADGNYNNLSEVLDLCSEAASALRLLTEQPGEPAAEPVSSIDCWQRRGHHAPLFSVGDPVRFLGVESEITEVRERQYRLHGGTIAWEHELERIPETKPGSEA